MRFNRSRQSRSTEIINTTNSESDSKTVSPKSPPQERDVRSQHTGRRRRPATRTCECCSPVADFGEIGPHEIGPHEIGVVPQPHNVASLLQQVFVDVVTQTSSLERSGFDFVPAGTRDNSPALQCWDDGCSDPFESRQGRKRSDHCLSSLTGLCDCFCLVPSTEVLGYFQSVPHGTQARLGLTTIVSSIGIVESK